MLGIEGLRTPEWVAPEATTVALGPVGAAIIELLVVSSCTGNINGTMQASARACYTVVKSSILFGWLQYVLPKYRTPLLPVLAHFALGTVIPLRLHPRGLLSCSSAVSSLNYRQ